MLDRFRYVSFAATDWLTMVWFATSAQVTRSISRQLLHLRAIFTTAEHGKVAFRDHVAVPLSVHRDTTISLQTIIVPVHRAAIHHVFFWKWLVVSGLP